MWSLLATLSAAFNGLGSVLQDRGAKTVTDRDAMRLRMVSALARNPATLGGIAALAVGVCLQAAALGGAPLTLVEPILVAELPIALLLAAVLFGVRLDLRAWVGVLLTAAGLAGVLWAARPSGGSVSRAGTSDWVLLGAATAASCALLIGAARRAHPGARAALVGAAAGIGHGFAATSMKVAAVAGSKGLLPLLGTWQLYGMLLVGGGSLYLYQNALQAGPLAAAQPALSIADPGVSACCGVLMFGERIRGGGFAGVELACVALAVAGVVVLAGSSAAIGRTKRTAAEVSREAQTGRREAPHAAG